MAHSLECDADFKRGILEGALKSKKKKVRFLGLFNDMRKSSQYILNDKNKMSIYYFYCKKAFKRHN